MYPLKMLNRHKKCNAKSGACKVVVKALDCIEALMEDENLADMSEEKELVKKTDDKHPPCLHE